MPILEGNNNDISGYIGHSNLPPSPTHISLSLPLYLRFVLSQQTHLSSPLSTQHQYQQQQQENIIYLDHGFQLALFLHPDENYIDSNSIDKDGDNNYRHKYKGVYDSPPLSSQSTTVVDYDSITTTPATTATATPTATHTFLSFTKEPHGLYSKERINNNNEDMSPDFYQHIAESSEATTAFHHEHDNNLTGKVIKGIKSTVLEMTLTIRHQNDGDDEEDEYAKEYYAAMIHTIHLFEIDLDCDRLYMSKAVDGHDLIRHGISFLVETDNVVKTELSTLGILLSPDPLELLVPPDVIAQSAADHPFGRSMLIHFLLDTDSADIAYAPLSASVTSSSSSITSTPRSTHSILYSLRPQLHMIHAHSAIMRQFPSFHRLIRNFSRPNDNPKIYKLVDIDPQAMRLLINFLYLTQIEGPGYTGIVDWRPIFQLAHRFHIPHLVELSLSELCKGMRMRVETAAETLFGWAYQHPDYEDRLVRFMAKSLSDDFSPAVDECLEPYRGHREFQRVCRKVTTLKLATRRLKR